MCTTKAKEQMTLFASSSPDSETAGAVVSSSVALQLSEKRSEKMLERLARKVAVECNIN